MVIVKTVDTETAGHVSVWPCCLMAGFAAGLFITKTIILVPVGFYGWIISGLLRNPR